MSLLPPKAIFTSLSPNVQRDDAILALKLIFLPSLWKRGKAIEKLESSFREYLGVRYAISFNGGRSAFTATLKSLNFKEGDEILLQAFTCNAAVNPILWSGLKPVFVDCDGSFNLDPKDLEKKITNRSKAVIVQHTFGQPANLNKILEICRKYNLTLIEDCAHSLGAEYNGRKVGTFGKVSFFSFSRDKIISSVYGGMVATNDKELGEKIRNLQKGYGFPSSFWTLQQLLHPFLTKYIILPLYRFPSLGKFFINALQISRVLSKAVYKKEKQGKKPIYFPKKMPNALAILTLHQFKKLEEFNRHRQEIAKFYSERLAGKQFSFQKNFKESKRIFMRFPVLLPKGINSDIILKRARRKRIFLNDGWRKSPVVPPDTNLAKMRYKKGSCPKAEEIAERIVNLPTHINISNQEEERIIKIIKNFIKR